MAASGLLTLPSELQPLMHAVCRMQLMDTTELALYTGQAVSTTDHRLKRLKRDGLIGSVPHAYGPLARTQRVYSTRRGIEETALARQMTPLQYSRQYRITDPLFKSLVDRIDGIAVIYRFASGISRLSRNFSPISIEVFGSDCYDALIRRRVGGSIGILRQGRARLRAAFGVRLGQVVQQSESERLGATLILTDTEGDCDYALLSPRLSDQDSVYIGTEDEVVGPPQDVEFFTPDGGITTLGDLLQQLMRSSERAPVGPPVPKEGGVAEPDALIKAQPQFGLEKSGKSMVNLLFDWPLYRHDFLETLLGVTSKRVKQITNTLLALGLITERTVRDVTYYALTEDGIRYDANRDRASPGVAFRRWSVVGPRPARWFGGHMRKLWRDLSHTDAVHWFIASLADEARTTPGYRLLSLDPPNRSSREGVLGTKKVAIEPDASGWIHFQDDEHDQYISFVLEWERRGVTASRAAGKISLYERYWESGSQWDDGTPPLALFVFDGPSQERRFLKSAEEGRDALVPFATSHRKCLEDHGALGLSWRLPYDDEDDERWSIWEIENDLENDVDEG